MKILYAASNREGGSLQLFRFLTAIYNKPYTVKIAAYKKAVPNIPVDWNLDALRNLDIDSYSCLNNDNLRVYHDQVKDYNPDLIISDLEYFTSYVALILNKRIWQVSQELLYYATSITQKNKIGLFSKYGILFKPDRIKNERILNFINNSEKNFVYSHLGDTGLVPIDEKFEWLRPYFATGKINKAAEHNVVAAMIKNDKSTINFIRNYDDTVLFSSFLDEKYSDIVLKDLYNHIEFGNNIKNCNLFVSVGHADLLADAYYNGKFAFILPNFKEKECIVNSMYAEYFNLGKIIYDGKGINFTSVDQEIKINPAIRSLVEKIDDI